MAFFQFKNIKISGVASTVPTKVVRGVRFYDSVGEEAVKKFRGFDGREGIP